MNSRVVVSKSERQEALKAFGIFMFLMIAFSAVFQCIMILSGNTSIDLIMGIMWSPGLAAICTCLFLKRKSILGAM